MLWNSIFEFFVKYVFGGNFNGVEYQANIGFLGTANIYTSRLLGLSIQGFGNYSGTTYTISLGNYLSLLATIFTTSLIVVLCCLFVYKIIKLVGGLITR